jgi:hypothetical protein
MAQNADVLAQKKCAPRRSSLVAIRVLTIVVARCLHFVTGCGFGFACPVGVEGMSENAVSVGIRGYHLGAVET